MPQQDKNILLISYIFPPHYGIGGRRWAKHAKALTQIGYTVYVITSPNPYKQDSLWNKDVQDNPKIVISEIPSNYPFVLLKTSLNFFEKVLYKFWITILSVLTKRNYFDRSLFWNKNMLQKANELIKKHKIKNVICTGGPFGTMYYATILKKQNKDIFLINDLRDPWTWAPNWGFPSLTKSRMKEEELIEQLMVFNSDVVTVPTEGLKNFLSNKYPDHISKFTLIPHVYDEDEIIYKEKNKTGKTRLIYYGSIYEGIENLFEQFFKFLKENKNYILDIYSDNLTKLNTLNSNYQLDNVNSYNSLSPKELFIKFQNYDYVLLINPEYNKNNISTKYYEIIYTRTPIILISPEGIATDFITNNRLGVSLICEKSSVELSKLSEKLASLNYNFNFDISDMSLKSVTNKISAILETK